MNILWRSTVCILCLEEKPLTKEHVLPRCLGGQLTSKFLCKDCNSLLGAGIEADASKSPEIRTAVCFLAKELPELYEAVENGQEYKSLLGSESFRHTLRNGVLGEQKLPDGSLVVPEQRAEEHLRRLLKKEGTSEAHANQALRQWETAAPGKIIELSETLSAKKWESVPAHPLLTDANLNSLVLLKIVYEFTALILGSSVLNRIPPLDQIRHILRSQGENAADRLVLRKDAEQYAPFHGICFHGNQPFASFQVRLFGKLAYLVTLPNIALDSEVVIYTLDLESGTHDIQVRS